MNFKSDPFCRSILLKIAMYILMILLIPIGFQGCLHDLHGLFGWEEMIEMGVMGNHGICHRFAVFDFAMDFLASKSVDK